MAFYIAWTLKVSGGSCCPLAVVPAKLPCFTAVDVFYFKPTRPALKLTDGYLDPKDWNDISAARFKPSVFWSGWLSKLRQILTSQLSQK